MCSQNKVKAGAPDVVSTLLRLRLWWEQGVH